MGSSDIEEKRRVELQSSSNSSSLYSSSATPRSSPIFRPWRLHLLLLISLLILAPTAIMYHHHHHHQTNPSSLLPLLLLSLGFSSSSPTMNPSSSSSYNNSPGLPMVINTWAGPFTAATDSAYLSLLHHHSLNSTTPALDAVQIGCTTCETNQCDGTVGFGGSPDENCETTLDALIIDGDTLNSGSVASLRRIKNAIAVARAVLDHTTHSMLAGDLATEFALSMGLGPQEDLTTPESLSLCQEWKRSQCQPNYRVDVLPNADQSCGPYTPLALPLSSSQQQQQDGGSSRNKRGKKSGIVGHDTISLIALTNNHSMAAGTSTNGASHKIPGRVGDGPIMGSGSYVDSQVGGCGATGDGDVMMRFLPCYQAVENLRLGMPPREAAEDVVRRMLRRVGDTGGDSGLQSGVVVVDREGRHGGAGSGWTFEYSVRGGDMKETEVFEVEPLVL